MARSLISEEGPGAICEFECAASGVTAADIACSIYGLVSNTQEDCAHRYTNRQSPRPIFQSPNSEFWKSVRSSAAPKDVSHAGDWSADSSPQPSFCDEREGIKRRPVLLRAGCRATGGGADTCAFDHCENAVQSSRRQLLDHPTRPVNLHRFDLGGGPQPKMDAHIV